MTVPETHVARTKRWIDARNKSLPERAASAIRYELDVDAEPSPYSSAAHPGVRTTAPSGRGSRSPASATQRPGRSGHSTVVTGTSCLISTTGQAHRRAERHARTLLCIPELTGVGA